MKRTFVLIAILSMIFMGGSVFAHPVFVTPVSAAPIHNTLNAEFDAPHLIGLKQIHKDLWIGTSVAKPLATNLFYDSFAGFEDDQGYLITAKITFDGCLLNCP